MASPFENLIQAAQFGVQTKMGYDQMAEKRRESTQNLLQRRAEQEQQNQQFLAEMNVKDRQLKMQSDQFGQTMGLEREKFKAQEKMAIEDLAFRKESFGKEFGLKKDLADFEKSFRNKEFQYKTTRGEYSPLWYNLEYYKYRDRDGSGKTIEPEYKGPFVRVKIPGEELWGPDKMTRGEYAWMKGKEAGAQSKYMPFTASLLGMAKGAYDYSGSEYSKKHQMTAQQYVKTTIKNIDEAAQKAADSRQKLDPLTTADALNSVYNAVSSNYEDFNKKYGKDKTDALLDQIMARSRQFGIPLEKAIRQQSMAGQVTAEE